ncbi:hypothetical protein [Corynebacterium sp. UBA2622]|uniref:hypothetical protein n=1 Tax=Corynebacterium sp. UBA2622 TaxID=1946393 RepID=UPI0025C106E3|nr:hypothetical protein [Corynebacterium sp. UBA2622]
MLKLNQKYRRWIITAVVLWLIVLAALIAIPMSRATNGAQSGHTNSLQQTLQNSTPGEGDAMVGQLVDPSRVYDTDKYAGYITLCPNEPEALSKDKIEQLGINEADVNLTGKYGYMVLLPAQGTDVGLDRVDLAGVNICTMPMNQPYPLNAPLPFYMDNSTWTLGANAQ